MKAINANDLHGRSLDKTSMEDEAKFHRGEFEIASLGVLHGMFSPEIDNVLPILESAPTGISCDGLRLFRFFLRDAEHYEFTDKNGSAVDVANVCVIQICEHVRIRIGHEYGAMLSIDREADQVWLNFLKKYEL